MSHSPPFAVVTGAASAGIGEAIAKQLLADGFEVFGTFEPSDRDRANGMATMGALELVELDHTDREATARVLAKVGSRPVDALVCAQAYFAMEWTDTLDFDLWDRVVAVNLSAPLVAFDHLQPLLTRGSSVVMIASSEGFRGSYGAIAYAATSAAMRNVAKTLANRCGGSGIRVNVVAPGWIADVMEGDDPFPAATDLAPLHRLGDPHEVAAAVSFLTSDVSSYVTGTSLVVDGGYSGSDPIAAAEFATISNTEPVDNPAD